MRKLRINLWGVGALLLFSGYTPIAVWAVNVPRGTSMWRFLVVWLGAFVFGLVVSWLLSSLLGPFKAAGSVATALFVFFGWKTLGSLMTDVLPAIPGWVIASLVFVVLVLLALRFGNTREYKTAALIMGIALVAAPLPGLIAWFLSAEVEIPIPAEDPVIPGINGDGVDIYVFVVDGYGRSDVLADLYGFSNEAFEHELEERGFFIPMKARANYSMTAAAVSSLLDMNYLVESGTVPDHRLRISLYEVIRGKNQTVRALKADGFRFVFVESGWDGSRCGPAVDICYRAGFLDEASWTLLGRTPLEKWLDSTFGHAFASNGLRVFDDVIEEAHVIRGAPRFVFAHTVLPHPPLTLDQDCEERSEPPPEGGAVGSRALAGTAPLDRRKEAYIEQLECVNQELLRFLDEVGDDSMVFITGDHGPDSLGQVSVPPDDWTDADVFERLSVFSAYRLPLDCRDRLSEDTDPINGMRVLFGCSQGVILSEIPKRSLVFPTPDGDPYPTTEVEYQTYGG